MYNSYKYRSGTISHCIVYLRLEVSSLCIGGMICGVGLVGWMWGNMATHGAETQAWGPHLGRIEAREKRWM